MVTDPRFTKEVSGFVYVYKDNEIPIQISGDSLLLTMCNRTATTSNLGNYFVSVSLPPTEEDLPKYSSLSIFYPELQQLNVDDIVIIKIPFSSYTEFIDGRSIELNVPISGYSTSSLKLFSSTYTGTQYAQKYGETSPLLGDNIAYLFCDSINLPYTGLTVDDMGVITSHANVNSWRPRSGSYLDRPSAVSYSEVKMSNDTINTDRRYRINKSVFIDGLYNDFRGLAASYYDTFSNIYSSGSGKVGLAMLPGTNFFKVGDSITLDEFNHDFNPTYSGNVTVTAIYRDIDISYVPEDSPIDSTIYDIFLTNKTAVNPIYDDSGTAYISGGTYYNYDIPVGFVVLDMGLVVITHRDIVRNIPWGTGFLEGGGANPGSGTTNVYFDGASTTIYGDLEAESSLNFSSLDTVFQLKATCNCLLGEFYISNNGTWQKNTVDNPLAEDDPVAITEIGFYNEMNELVAVSKLSQPVLKGFSDLLTFEVDINL